jgi:signal transduction histidine kinase
MNDIHWSAVTVILCNLPSLPLFYYPFRKQLKIKVRLAVAINAAIFVAYVAGFYLLAPMYFSFSFLQVYRLTLIVPNLIVVLLIVDEIKTKIMYFIFMMITYLVTAAKVGNYFVLMFGENTDYFLLSTVNVAIIVITMPLMFFYLQRIYSKTIHVIETAGMKIWQFMWIIPFVFLFISLISNMRFDPEIVASHQFIILNSAIIASMFISSIILLRVLQISNEAVAAKREAEALERVNQLKTDLMRTISHETMTPLSVMKIYAEITAKDARKSGMGGEFVSNLDTIAAEAGRLADLMEEMRQLSLAREYAKDTQPVDVSKIISQIARLYARILERKGTALKLDIADGLPIAFGNGHELTQVLFNLLRNSDNHTENGTVAIAAEFTEGVIKVTVTDTGTGIPSELLPRVFERGAHGENEGSGFGLAICRDIITAYGGKIWIESEPGKGTAAVFTLPPYTKERGGNIG